MRSNSWQQPPFLDAIGKGSCGSTAHIADPILLVGAGSIVARHAKWELTASLCIAEICKRCKVVVRLARALARLAMQQSLRTTWGDCILLLDSDSLDDGHARFLRMATRSPGVRATRRARSRGLAQPRHPFPCIIQAFFLHQHNFSQSARTSLSEISCNGRGHHFQLAFLDILPLIVQKAFHCLCLKGMHQK